MSTLEKNVTYNAQGDIISDFTPATTATRTTYSGVGVVPASSYTTTTTYPTTYTSPTTADTTWKGKFGRAYNKVETAMRNKFDSSTGPKSRSDPLGGYTVKGPGYYEKKHKFTRRVTTRGTPPSSFSTSTPTYSTPLYTSSTTTTTIPPPPSTTSSYISPSSVRYSPSTPGPGGYLSTLPPVPPSTIPNSYTTPSVPVS